MIENCTLFYYEWKDDRSKFVYNYFTESLYNTKESRNTRDSSKWFRPPFPEARHDYKKLMKVMYYLYSRYIQEREQMGLIYIWKCHKESDHILKHLKPTEIGRFERRPFFDVVLRSSWYRSSDGCKSHLSRLWQLSPPVLGDNHDTSWRFLVSEARERVHVTAVPFVTSVRNGMIALFGLRNFR